MSVTLAVGGITCGFTTPHHTGPKIKKKVIAYDVYTVVFGFNKSPEASCFHSFRDFFGSVGCFKKRLTYAPRYRAFSRNVPPKAPCFLTMPYCSSSETFTERVVSTA